MDRRNFIFTAGATVASLSVLHNGRAYSLGLKENVSSGQPPDHPPLLFGTDYYPDQTPESLWEQDAVAMAAMGITNVRIAEFAWALMEPREGAFDFAWLQRAVKILNAHNIAVILGTPSAAPPNWLTQKYPEVMMVNDHGMTLATGARRFTCPTNKTYRRLSLAVATEMAHAFASTPGVIGWQNRQRTHSGRQRAVLLQVLPRGLSAVAAGEVWLARCHQPGVGYGVLEQYVYGLCADSGAATVGCCA